MLTVSIVIPVYNVTDYIEECIKSVMAQTYCNIECVIVDDATPDDSIDKCERLISEYQETIFFRIVRHEHNRGLSAARNTGTDNATGDYVFYLDSDDFLPDYCIASLVRPLLNDSTIEIVMGDYEKIPNTGQHRRTLLEKDVRITTNIRDPEFFNKNFDVFAWNKLIKRDFLLQNKIRFKEGLLFEDYLWDFFVLKHLTHLYLVSETTYYYCSRPNSLTKTLSRETKRRSFDTIMETITDNLSDGGMRRGAKYYYGFLAAILVEIINPRKQSEELWFSRVSCKKRALRKMLDNLHC